jgi:hypothetical protein
MRALVLASARYRVDVQPGDRKRVDGTNEWVVAEAKTNPDAMVEIRVICDRHEPHQRRSS